MQALASPCSAQVRRKKTCRPFRSTTAGQASRQTGQRDVVCFSVVLTVKAAEVGMRVVNEK